MQGATLVRFGSTHVRQEPTTLERIPYEACPLCGSQDFRQFKSASCKAHALYDPRLPGTIDWVECLECEHVFTSGFFGTDAEKILFSKTQPSQEPGYDIERQREIAAAMVDRVIAVAGYGSEHGQWLPIHRDWLDVGCGSGALLATAAEYGFRATGLDLRESTTKTLAYLGYDARYGEIGSLTTEMFDVISLCDVVEHVDFPSRLLKSVRQHLLPQGYVVVSMPNSDSLPWRALTLADSNPYWGELEHYHNFSRESLYRLLRQHGLEPVSYGVSRRYRACMEVIARAN